MKIEALTPQEMRVIIERVTNPMIPMTAAGARRDMERLLGHMRFLATQLKESQASLMGLKMTLMALCRREKDGSLSLPYAEASTLHEEDELHGQDIETEAGPVKVLRYIPYTPPSTVVQ